MKPELQPSLNTRKLAEAPKMQPLDITIEFSGNDGYYAITGVPEGTVVVAP